MLVPFYGFVAGDTVGVLVLAHDDMPVAQVIELVRRATAVRVAAGGPLELLYEGRVVDPALTVSRAGLRALARVDVRPVGHLRVAGEERCDSPS
jgi:hypothetical protein